LGAAARWTSSTGGAMILVSSVLRLLWCLDNPYHGGVGDLRPVAIEGTLKL
jgi:hypothetical protein